jgi:DNA repair protein RadC
LPPELSPRERLLGSGPEPLSNAELLALVAGRGADEAASLGLATRLLAASGGLAGLRRASRHDLLETPGMGVAKSCAVLAAIELGKRLAVARGPERPVVGSPRDAEALLRGRLADLDREHFVCVLLDTKNRVISSPTVSIGTLSASLVHPREAFKPALRASAANVLFAHNHPSGDVAPSAEDRTVTRRLRDAGELLGVEVLDHVILGDGGMFSFKENGML